MRELALFAGAGGGLLATTHLLGWRTVAAVEIDPYRREVLLRRQLDGVLDLFPIWDDIRTFRGEELQGWVDVVTAGFPCQPFSVAGKRQGEDDERNMWPDTIRVVREVRPRYVFLENVPGLLAGSHGYFGHILGELAQAGYDAEWCVLGADDAGAPHRRKRLWVVGANSEQSELREQQRRERSGQSDGVEPRREGAAVTRDDGADGNVADSKEAIGERRGDGAGRRGGKPLNADGHGAEGAMWWSPEPDVGRVADGVAHRVDRLGAIGDGQVPAVAALAWNILTQKEPRPFGG